MVVSAQKQRFPGTHALAATAATLGIIREHNTTVTLTEADKLHYFPNLQSD
ncbi:hypothetical protein AOG2_30190 [Geobacter sp. AOG2]|nr:hypothetical protein AOG2_30190 [Geobacter sp. AOG2]